MNKEEVEKLLDKYRNGACNREESALVESWHLDVLKASHPDTTHHELLHTKKQMWNAIAQETEIKAKTQQSLWIKIAAAAILIAAISSILYLQSNKITANTDVFSQHLEKDISPGGNKATLTLADGSKISLTDASNGVIAKQAGISITKTDKGELVYTLASGTSKNSKSNLYNTIETPRGGQYQINLPDGTRVWLNAASSLRYPAAFNTEDRIVELQGEAYFEVAKHSDKKGNRVPFKVISNLGEGRNQEVEVLGTHFNINAYGDESSNKTTLLEGLVKVSNLKTHTSNFLKPGQQSIIQSASAGVLVKEVDPEEAVTWKDGYFSFNEENLETIMNKISRWYNVDVDYRGNKINKIFGGRISRFNSVNEVLDMLQTTEAVHFKIEGRRILVMP